MNRKWDRIHTIIKTLGELRFKGRLRPETIRRADAAYDLPAVFKPEAFAGLNWETALPGDTWGGADRHFWFDTQVKLPADWRGEKVLLCLSTGATDLWNTDNPQVIVYRDGQMFGTMDLNHNRILLEERAAGGETVGLSFYAYSNSAGRTNFFDVSLCALDREIDQLYYDLKVLWDLADLMGDEENGRLELEDVLNRCVNLLDLRDVSGPDFAQSVKEAEAFLQTAHYSAERPLPRVVVHGIGHTHIDVAWKWPLRQTRQKAVRSFLTVIRLMEEYPRYRFMSSQPQLYQFVKEEAPWLYEKIRERVREGRWETEGAMWLEADCNLSSGESLIRHILYGKAFFQEEFGTGDGQEVLWLPDVFGYCVALPQILRQAGIKYFMTTKLGWNEYNQIPNDTFYWRGLDGSEVLTYFITTSDYKKYPQVGGRKSFETTYNGRMNASQVMGTWQRYRNKDLSRDVLTCFGFGDGGGGTTREMLEEEKRLEAGAGNFAGDCPAVRITGVNEFFHILENNLEGKKVPRWCGELYLEFHRGTYTSMARIKKNNRECEFLLMDAELLCVMAGLADQGFTYPRKELEEAWKLLLLNQFHDILPGSSIGEVYRDSDRQFAKLREICAQVMERAKRGIEAGYQGVAEILETAGAGRAVGAQCGGNYDAGRAVDARCGGNCDAAWAVDLQCGGNRDAGRAVDTSGMLFVANQLGFDRSGLVETVVNGQKRLLLAENVPSKGVLAFGLTGLEEPEKEERPGVVLSCETGGSGFLTGFRTEFYDLRFDGQGQIISLYDRREEREVIAPGGAGNALVVFEDRPESYDAWNIDESYEEKQWTVTDVTRLELVENTAVRAVVRCEKRFMKSVVRQDICFYRHTGRIDFDTTVDWRESQLLLKAAFPVDVLAERAVYDVQFGNVERPTHRNTSWEQAKFEVCAHKWADLSEYGYGVALLNNCKYGYDIHDGVMRLTLIKSGIFPYPEADQEIHRFTYALYPHAGDFRAGRVVQEAYDLNCPLIGWQTEGKRKNGIGVWGDGKNAVMRKTTAALTGAPHTGFSLLRVRAENVIVETVKQAEDGDGIVIRLYEAYGKRTRTAVEASILAGKQLWACGCMENRLQELKHDGERAEIAIKPYEILTLRIS